MKSAISLVLIFLLALCAGCGAQEPAAPQPVAVPNPITEYNTLEEMEQAVGFSVPLNPAWMEAYLPNFTSILDEMAQIDFSDQGEHVLTYRVEKTDAPEDISGDYSVYADETTVEIHDMQVTIYGNDGSDHLATWYDGVYSYSILYTSGIEESDIVASIEGIEYA